MSKIIHNFAIEYKTNKNDGYTLQKKKEESARS